MSAMVYRSPAMNGLDESWRSRIARLRNPASRMAKMVQQEPNFPDVLRGRVVVEGPHRRVQGRATASFMNPARACWRRASRWRSAAAAKWPRVCRLLRRTTPAIPDSRPTSRRTFITYPVGFDRSLEFDTSASLQNPTDHYKNGSEITPQGKVRSSAASRSSTAVSTLPHLRGIAVCYILNVKWSDPDRYIALKNCRACVVFSNSLALRNAD